MASLEVTLSTFCLSPRRRVETVLSVKQLLYTQAHLHPFAARLHDTLHLVGLVLFCKGRN